MTNLYDYWLAHKSRYDYFLQDERFNTDEEIMNRLQLQIAIGNGQQGHNFRPD